ncbi:FecR family protein [Aestuariivivens insulae]|uniref:FecR family protein n=1 Tax=Aestuariivivens insulae TaxID=1621988 RepID=UPI001F599873|nr:FecR family protein [Aestuariivivens insulae]
MKNTEHNIDYFLRNPHFISWVKHPTSDSDLFWKKWLKNHPEAKEAFYRAKAILQRIDFKKAQTLETRQEEILDNILKDKTSDSFRSEGRLKEKVFNLSPWLLKGAAAVLLLFLVFNLGKSLKADSEDNLLSIASIQIKQNKKGERAAFYLPDSTKVFLNAGSTLKYPTTFNSKTREVVLEGEAYFDVTHDAHKKFMVKSGDLVTVVHGTAFNVRAYTDEGRINVSLERGRVSVHSQREDLNSISYDMLPGEKLEVKEDFALAKKLPFDYTQEFGWKDGILVFNDADLETFIALTELWYGVTIEPIGESNDNWEINGSFKNESLENVLKSLEFSRGISYKIDNTKVMLYLGKQSNK